MGDPRRLKKKFTLPNHPWQKSRIEEEKVVLVEYGLKRKNEYWKVNSQLKRYFQEAKSFIGSTRLSTTEDKSNFLKKLSSLGLLKENSQLEDVLNFTLKDLMERRLQTVLVRKRLAGSMIQARQFIIHEHISIGDKKITRPSYMVDVAEEALVRYADDSPFINMSHPEIKMIKEAELEELKKQEILKKKYHLKNLQKLK